MEASVLKRNILVEIIHIFNVFLEQGIGILQQLVTGRVKCDEIFISMGHQPFTIAPVSAPFPTMILFYSEGAAARDSPDTAASDPLSRDHPLAPQQALGKCPTQ